MDEPATAAAATPAGAGPAETRFRIFRRGEWRRAFRLEEVFWTALEDAAADKGVKVADYVRSIVDGEPEGAANSSSLLRVHAATWLQDRIARLEVAREQREILHASNAGDLLHQLLQILAQQRLTTGQANLVNTQPNGHANETLNLLEAENLGALRPLAGNRIGVRNVGPTAAVEVVGRLRFRQAVEAAEVTAVCDADPQVAHDATMRIHQQTATPHYLGVVGAGAFVPSGATTFAPPSCLSSTFRLKLLVLAVWLPDPAMSFSAPFLSDVP